MPKICKGDIYDFFAKYEQSLDVQGKGLSVKFYNFWLELAKCILSLMFTSRYDSYCRSDFLEFSNECRRTRYSTELENDVIYKITLIMFSGITKVKSGKKHADLNFLWLLFQKRR